MKNGKTLNMKKVILLLVISLIVSSVSYSQKKQLTPYQLKVQLLTTNLINDLGLKNIVNKYSNTGNLGELMGAAEFIYACKTQKGILALLKFNSSLEQAKKLKNEIDFRNDKIIKDKEEAKREASIALKREIVKKKELEEQNKLKQIKYENSDYVKIKNRVKDDFSKWLIKGEYEKLESYNNRISSDGQTVFDSICFKAIKNQLIDENEYYSSVEEEYMAIDGIKLGFIELDRYDSEKEFFNVIINLHEKQINDTLNIKIEQAQNFKENHEINNSSLINTEWCFVENNLTPTKFTLENDQIKRTINLPKEILTKIELSSNDLQIDNLKSNIIFDFNKYQNYLIEKQKQFREKLFQKRKLDSIAESNIILKYEEFSDGRSIHIEESFKDEIISSMRVLAVKNNLDLSHAYDDYKIKFIVEKDGSLSEITIISSVGYKIIYDELIRLVTKKARFIPGKYKSTPCRTLCFLHYEPYLKRIYFNNY